MRVCLFRYRFFWIGLGLLATSHLYAQDKSMPRVSLTCAACTPSEALQQLSRSSGVNIVFSESVFEDCPKQNFHFDSLPLQQAVDRVVACFPVECRIFGNTLAISPRNDRLKVSGFVRDAETGELLLGAGLLFYGKNPVGAVSNEFGFFSAALYPGRYTCKVSYTGYQSRTTEMLLLEDRTWTVLLEPNTILPEVVVSAQTAGSDEEVVARTDKRRELEVDRLRTLGMPGGESDLLRLIAFEPGVQTGVDGLGGLHVRGGNADQNLFLLDDVPVYNPGHALGLFSIFNPSTVRQARFWKGDAPARFGGRASAVLDVRTRDGNMKENHAEATAGLFATSLTLEGPVVRDKSALLVSGRTTYFKPWLSLLSDKENLFTFSGDQVVYRFFDLNVKWNYLISDKDRVYVSFYNGGDQYSDAVQQTNATTGGVVNDRYGLSTNWGNTIAALRWNHVFGQRMFSNTVLRYSKFNYRNSQNFRSVFDADSGDDKILYDYGELYQSDVRDWSVKSDFTWYAMNNLLVRMGGAFTHHEFRPGALSVNYLQPGRSASSLDSFANAVLNNERLLALDAEAYAEAEWQFASLWRIEAGLRGTAFRQGASQYNYLLPGARITVGAEQGWSAWSGYHRNAQNLHQIGSYNISLPFELWVPSTSKVKPELAGQFTAGLGWQNGICRATLEAYDKHFDRVLTFLSTGSALLNGGSEDASGWEDRVAEGTGRSYGLEASFACDRPNTGLRMSYTLSKTDRQFEQINSGRSFPFRYDRRHNLSLGVRQRITPLLSADVSWVFATGYPITLTGVKFRHETPGSAPARDVYLYTEVNGYRLPAYHRLDATLSLAIDRKKVSHFIQVGVYNAYNRANPFYLYLTPTTSRGTNAIQYTLLPVLPILQYRIRI